MPETLHLDAANPHDLQQAGEILRAGGTVVFPTETVYGLGANALDPSAVASIFAAKQRPPWDPLIVHVASVDDAMSLVQMDPGTTRRVEALTAAFWPGPLTLLLPRRAHVPDAVTAGRPLVGIRIPAHPAALALLRVCGVPLAAPSANRFGHTSPTTAQHVLDDLAGRIDAVLDAGSCRIGLESTVLDPTHTPMTLYRPGALTPEQLAATGGARVDVFQPSLEAVGEAIAQSSLPAPGVGLRHYAPSAKLILTTGTPEALQAALMQGATLPARTGILLPTGWIPEGNGYIVQPWGQWEEPESLAAALFSGLRQLELQGTEVIYCPLPAPGGMSDAIRDRLQKAARIE